MIEFYGNTDRYTSAKDERDHFFRGTLQLLHATLVCVRLSVRPSVKSRYCIEASSRPKFWVGVDASFHLSSTVL